MLASIFCCLCAEGRIQGNERTSGYISKKANLQRQSCSPKKGCIVFQIQVQQEPSHKREESLKLWTFWNWKALTSLLRHITGTHKWKRWHVGMDVERNGNQTVREGWLWHTSYDFLYYDQVKIETTFGQLRPVGPVMGHFCFSWSKSEALILITLRLAMTYFGLVKSANMFIYQPLLKPVISA